jgi:hypothetical protein
MVEGMPLSADIARLRTVGPVTERQWVRLADFDRLDDEGCLRISLRFDRGPRPPRPGEYVYLLDAEGRGCVGTVERVDGWDALVSPDWDTWTG